MSMLAVLQDKLSIALNEGVKDIVVAYSGGVDSHVLLHALNTLRQSSQYNFQLHAIHIHHGISHNSDHWQTHCQQVCAELDIPFQTSNVAVQIKPRQSLEAQARDARYKKLKELAPTDSHVWLAQHQDDQLETFLLQLKRGSGPKGLSSMNSAWTENCALQLDKEVGFFRPLLDVSQQDILDYAQQHPLVWCEDESNQNTSFDRNFLRHDVIPQLQNRWPEIASSVARSAMLCAQQQSLLDEICVDKLTSAIASNNSLYILKLNDLSVEWLHQVVRYWLSEKGIPSPSLAVLSQLKSQVMNAVDDATPILQWQGWQFRRFREQLFVISTPLVLDDFDVKWQGEDTINLPEGLGFLSFNQVVLQTSNNDHSSPIINPNLGPISIRLGGYSSKFKPKGSPHSKPLKQWFKQWAIFPWIRSQALLLMQGEQLIAVLLEGKWKLSESNQKACEQAIEIKSINPSDNKGN